MFTAELISRILEQITEDNFLISVQCVALRNLDLLIKTGWSVIFPFFC